MSWTVEQKKAIDTEGVNILVSAAAGSGKTTVLIERISRLILEREVDVDRFLITTFTNAAATEMKERLEKEISDRIEGSEGKRKEFLQRQMLLLPDACIETFHSFCISIIRDYFFLTDIQPGFSIGDETRINLMKREVLDQIFEDRFENDTERFKDFLRTYSAERSDDKIKDSILRIYTELLSIPDYMDWARERVDKLGSSSPVDAIGITAFIRKETVGRLKEALGYYERAAMMLDDEDTGGLYLKARQDVENLRKLADDIGHAGQLSIEDMGDLLGGIRMNQMRTSGKVEKAAYTDDLKDRVTSARKKGKSIIDGIKKKYLSQTSEKANEDISSLRDDTAYFLAIIEDLDRLIKERKREENIIDFDDAMHYAIDILRDSTASEDYKSRFEYIFIDEYQDSNYLQEKIIEKIARNNNLFMVGDIKQSIYKFRLAEPDIFKDKYAAYMKEEKEDSVKIDLNNNFRSKGNIRCAVNTIFEDIMEGYDENAALKGPEDGGPDGPEAELHIICSEERGAREEAGDSPETTGDKPQGIEEAEGFEGKGEDAVPEEVEELTEAELVARIIKEHIGREFTDKKGDTRKLDYSDIAVLSRGGRAVSQIERYLNNEDIPAYGVTGGGYYETVEIKALIDLLEVIDNIRQDVPLIGVMSGMFFDFTPMELAKIRIEKRDISYYSDAVMAYGEDGEDPELKAKIAAMLHKIDRWRQISRSAPLDELMRILLYETGYYDYCSSLPAGHRRVSNLRLLMEKAADYEENSYLGLYGFLSYVDAMKRTRQQVNEAPVAGEGENVVRVMTVHKSKGLEFPMVILVGAGKSLRGTSEGYSPVMHKDYSIGLPIVDRNMHTRKKTLLQQVIAGRKQSDDIDEEIRILYVALTRPMDKLVVIGSVKDADKLPEVPTKGTFLEMVYPAFVRIGDEAPDKAAVYLHSANQYLKETELRQEPSGEMNEICSASGDVIDEIDRRLSFEYPYRDSLDIRPKYSVSMFVSGWEDDADHGGELPVEKMSSMEIRSLEKEEGELTAAQVGTVMHDIMERIDFERAEKEGVTYIRSFIDEMKEKDILTEREYDVASTDTAVGNIAGFFNSDIGRRAANADRLYKEKEFIMRHHIKGEPVVIQGKIDCWFEDDGGIVLIDYKNNKTGRNRSEEDIIDEYREQVKLYSEALEKAEGRPVSEAWLYLFRQRRSVPVRI